MPQDVRERILAVQEKSGFVSNLFLALAHQPAEFRASLAYHDALIEKEGGLSKTEREMIVVVTSATNDCQCPQLCANFSGPCICDDLQGAAAVWAVFDIDTEDPF